MKDFVETGFGGVLPALVDALLSPLLIPVLVVSLVIVFVGLHSYTEVLRERRSAMSSPVPTFSSGKEPGWANWEAGHQFDYDDEGHAHVKLWVGSTDVSQLDTQSVECEVQDEDGNVYRTRPRAPYLGGYREERGRHEAVYPASFSEETPPPEAGKRYNVRWTVLGNTLQLDHFVVPERKEPVPSPTGVFPFAAHQGPRQIEWTTEAHAPQRFIDTIDLPQAIRVIEPVRSDEPIKERNLPRTVRLPGGWLLIKKFSGTGMMVEENLPLGTTIRVEVYG